ncbi:WecB/TagA/CpsF family glycosyltransferase [Candidatus Dojkabacteria bacterium]|nr:WecB/TagA/CpsF family glycosyltransferase [Candidatus Dojkabacteria bacterium]
MTYKKISIIGQQINVITFKQVMEEIKKVLGTRKTVLIVPMNLHNIIELTKSKQIVELLQLDTSIAIADGVPLVIISKFKNKQLPERISGTDLVEETLSTKETKVFVISSNKSIGTKIMQKCSSVVDFWVAPIYKNAIPLEKNLMKRIGRIKPNVLIVALGCPTQEKWIQIHWEMIKNINVIISAGSALELITGEKLRAPKFLRDNGFEWLWRIILEPRRLAPRYIKDGFEIIKRLRYLRD